MKMPMLSLNPAAAALLSALFCLSLAGCSAVKSQPQNSASAADSVRIKHLLDATKALMATEQFDEAATTAGDCLKLDPDNRLGHLYRGYAFFRLNDSRTALADFNEAIRQNPGDYQGYEYRASAYQAVHRYRKAMEDFHHAVTLAPADAVAVRSKLYRELGLCQLAFGNLAEAHDSFSSAIQLTPSESLLFAARAISELQMNKIGACIADASMALRLDPNNASAYYVRSHAYGRLNQTQLSDEDDASARKLFAHSYLVTAQ